MYQMGVRIGAIWQIRLNDCGGGYEWVCYQGWRRGLFPDYFGQSLFILFYFILFYFILHALTADRSCRLHLLVLWT